MTTEGRYAGARPLRMRLSAGLIAGLLLAGSTSALLAEAGLDPQPGPPDAVPTSLRLVQALAEGTDLTAYVTVRDETGDPVPGGGIGPLQATLGAHPAEVISVTPFAETGEGVLYVFLVDISASLDAAQFGRIRDALHDWVGAMGEHDQAAILTFGTDVRTVVAPTDERARLTAALDALEARDPRTAFHEALAQGLALGQQRGERLPTSRALVILSDGLDDAPGGMTIEEVEARLADSPVPIYAIGFSRVRDAAQRERGLATMGRFARRSGGMFVDASSGEPGLAYPAMREAIRAVERVHLRCPTCVADGTRYRLRIALTVEGLTLADSVDVRLYPLAAAGLAPDEATAPDEPAPVSGDDQPPEPDAQAGVENNEPSTVPAPPAAQVNGAGGIESAEAEDPLQRLHSGVPWWIGVPVAAALAMLLGLLIHRRRRRSAPSVDATIPNNPLEGLDPVDPVDPAGVRPPGPPIPEPPHPPRVAGPSVALTFKSGARRGELVRLLLAPSALIGRSGGCDLALCDDDEVSAHHARLTAQAGRVLLADVGSTNGTLLNGVPLAAPTPLHDGDVIRVGQTELHVGGIGAW
ncbi:hypothetical protein CKO25_18980 [Thiocapsa imhoffii]|uniref:FHA domain-containing protein n=1 Tax=Thiocapsa imhoffii TaxID=382777 RepID=A0A9X1BA62_9GAMM|nr:FHA domain-containing protein [Thiocapsa imhoffii]MBK1646684.1 hypothetical protein [Thiocapsa imhoffii]